LIVAAVRDAVLVTDLATLAATLDGSPYSLPDDERSLATLQDMLVRAESLETRCSAVRQRLAAELRGLGGQASRTTEIYESNRIEGKLISLAETKHILNNEHMWETDQALARYTLQQALAYEPKVQDVVGLAAARILVDQYIVERDREVIEADIRDMHGLLFRGHGSGGRYKQYINEIAGSAHQPVVPVEVPANMHALVGWMQDSAAPLVWRSAVAHAWLTHIHPFDDGNGRIARLLANFVLGRGSYPPLIVRSSNDRPKYIQALGHSDQAGDISPLVRLFVRILDRGVKIMEKPGFAMQLFQLDLEQRSDDLYSRWTARVDTFFTDLSAHLLTYSLHVQVVGSLTRADFRFLQDKNSEGNAWFAKVRKPQDPTDILIWVGYPSDAMHRQLERDQLFPSFFLAERDPNPKAIRPYNPSVAGGEPRHDEICLLIDEGRALIRRGSRHSQVRIEDAAELFAAMLAEYLW
jgi:Fic family protein